MKNKKYEEANIVNSTRKQFFKLYWGWEHFLNRNTKFFLFCTRVYLVQTTNENIKKIYTQRNGTQDNGWNSNSSKQQQQWKQWKPSALDCRQITLYRNYTNGVNNNNFNSFRYFCLQFSPSFSFFLWNCWFQRWFF